MRTKVLVAWFVFSLLYGAIAFAESPSIELSSLEPERCTDVLQEAQSMYDTAPSTLLSLVQEALRRYCAGSGGIEIPDGLKLGDRGESTRSGEVSAEDASDELVLIAEAAYYIEIAQQIDAAAANDLLRRLLGPDPQPKN